MKAISPLLRLQYFLRRFRLLTISKSFIRPYLDYGDVIYQISNASFSSKLESVKYYAALAITGVSRGSFREKPLPELGLEHQHHMRWMRRLCLFYKVLSNKFPKYIQNLVPPI